MRKMFLSCALLMAAAVVAPVTADVVYEEAFVQGQVATDQCRAWIAFQAELVEQEYTSLTVSGSEDPDGISCTDPEAVKQIAAALNTNGTAAVTCDGRDWRVGACGPARELSANGSTCQCTNPGHILRACLTNFNWGGVNTPTCNAPSQTMKVVFGTGGPSCNYITKKYKQKKCFDSGCPTQRVDDCVYDSDVACEDLNDCAKKVKLKSGCADPEEKGKCKHVLSRCDCK